MIYLKISGRAGNQLFQYATVYAYKEKNNVKELINLSFEYVLKQKNKSTDNVEFCNYLTQFKINDYKVIQKIKYTNIQKMLDIIYRGFGKIVRVKCKILRKKVSEKDWKFLDKILHKIMNKNGLYYYFPTNIEFYESKTDNIIFFGSFEDSNFFNKYYLAIKNKILNIEYEKLEICQRIKDTNRNTVCITIRRGDFLSKGNIKKHYICNNEYFKKAMLEIEKYLKNPLYIVFSDDINWCKKNIRFPKGTIYETGENTIPEKIFMMAYCENFIISNSTFSWWAQYLSANNKKIVIAPREWNKFEYANNIYLDNWITI